MARIDVGSVVASFDIVRPKHDEWNCDGVRVEAREVAFPFVTNDQVPEHYFAVVECGTGRFRAVLDRLLDRSYAVTRAEHLAVKSGEGGRRAAQRKVEEVTYGDVLTRVRDEEPEVVLVKATASVVRASVDVPIAIFQLLTTGKVPEFDEAALGDSSVDEWKLVLAHAAWSTKRYVRLNGLK